MFTISCPQDQTFSGWDSISVDQKHVQVCLPLLAIANRTADPNAETQLQGNHCSFAHALIERRDLCPPFLLATVHHMTVNTIFYENTSRTLCYTLQRVFLPTQTLTSVLAAVWNSVSVHKNVLVATIVPNHPPVIEGQVLRVYEGYRDHEYRYNLLVGVTAVYYDKIDHIEVGDVVTISLPVRIRFKRTYTTS